MSDEDDPGFLARWSKRKQAARAAEARPVEPAPPAPTHVPEPAPPAPVAESGAPVEPPALPPIESLTHESDFTPFLRPGVSPALRNAALRKLWSDPAIRDAIGPARDYAWDWNTPGGVPGSGAPPTEAEVRAALAQLRGAVDSPPTDTPARTADTGHTAATPASTEKLSSVQPSAAPPASSAPARDEANRPPSAARRRHGGATPD